MSGAGIAAGLVTAVLACGCGQKWAADRGNSATEQADEAFDAGGGRKPTSRTLYALTRVLAAQGRDVECERLLRQILEGDPQFMPAYCGLAELQMRQQRVDDAVMTLSAGLIVSPKDPVMLNDLGVCHMVQNRPEEAARAFTQASGIRPENSRYRSNLAAALGLLGRYDESLALFQQVVSEEDAHTNLAVLCDARKDAARAAVERQKAAELHGKKPGE